MGDFVAIAEQFVNFYYQTFDSDRANLGGLYRDHSMLSFENSPFQGAQNIVEKLQSLPFQQVQHKVDTRDAQPGAQEGSIVVMVTGALMVDGSDKPMSFSQTFTLSREGDSYFVYNDIFRLVYPASG